MMEVQKISPKQLDAIHNEGQEIILVDVRMPMEYEAIHVECAQNIPLDELDKETLQNLSEGGKTIYLICQSGRRSAIACEKISSFGMDNIVSVDGGTSAWDAAGLPVVKGKGVISVERQVRIIAGLLAFVGAVLAITIDPKFAFISAFVGLGMAHAGITDSCAMGMILLKMPWNNPSKSKKNSPSASAGVSSSAG